MPYYKIQNYSCVYQFIGNIFISTVEVADSTSLRGLRAAEMTLASWFALNRLRKEITRNRARVFHFPALFRAHWASPTLFFTFG